MTLLSSPLNPGSAVTGGTTNRLLGPNCSLSPHPEPLVLPPGVLAADLEDISVLRRAVFISARPPSRSVRWGWFCASSSVFCGLAVAGSAVTFYLFFMFSIYFSKLCQIPVKMGFLSKTLSCEKSFWSPSGAWGFELCCFF